MTQEGLSLEQVNRRGNEACKRTGCSYKSTVSFYNVLGIQFVHGSLALVPLQCLYQRCLFAT